VVLSRAEVRAVLAQLDGTHWLIGNLLYGSGLRLMEALRLRVKDLVLERSELIVRDGKGGKDRGHRGAGDPGRAPAAPC
jgi:integrase